MPGAFTTRKSTARGGDTPRYTSATPQLYQIDIETFPTGANAYPTLLIQAAFDSDPLDNVPIWTDITPAVFDITITRGRSFELDSVAAGRLTITLDNRTRNFDPAWTAGPYYGALTTSRRIRVSAIFDAVTYPLFDGYVDSWPQLIDSNRLAQTQIIATDLFRWLAPNNVSTVAPAITNDPIFGVTNSQFRTGGQLAFETMETCQARINKILDLWPFPPNMRAIDAGNTFLCRDATLSATETSLNYIDRIVRTEAGRWFATADGKACFQARDHWMSDDRQLISQVTLSDDPAAPPGYQDISVDPADARYVKNKILRGQSGWAVPFIAQDWPSIRTNGELEDSRTDLLFAYQDDAAAQAAWQCAKYATATQRISRVALEPMSNPALLFPAVLGLELGSRVTASHVTAGVGDPFVQQSWIENVGHTITGGGAGSAHRTWVTDWQLAPVDIDTY